MQKTVILTKNGDPEGISQMDQKQVSRLRGKTFQSGSDEIGVIDTQQIVSEETVQQGDYNNLARQLGKSVAGALRDHGDEVAFLSARGISDKGCTIHVQYKPDEQGEIWEDDFQFGFDQDNVTLDNEVICQIGQISGTISIQKDLVKDALAKYIESKSSPSMTPNKQAAGDLKSTSSVNGGIAECGGTNILVEFSAAVDAYRENPSDKERIKDLFRQARNFEGDDIAHKFKNAVEMYKSQTPSDGLTEPAIEKPDIEAAVVADEEPVVSPSDPRHQESPENTCEDLCMNMSLFIRLLEYAREDAKEDVDLHFVAENLDKICKEKGCASMEDYESIVNCPESEPKEPKEEMDEYGEDFDTE